MEKIKIITDSTLDLPAELIREKNIEVLPLLINFGEESYLDGVEITTKEMIDKINATGILPTTAQVTPNRFEETFKKYLDEGYKIVVLTLSSDMSGTYQSACIAKDMLESDDIVVIDSRNVTSGLGLLVLKACELRDKGLGIKEIEEEILKAIPKVKDITKADNDTPTVVKKPKIKVHLKVHTKFHASSENKLPISIYPLPLFILYLYLSFIMAVICLSKIFLAIFTLTIVFSYLCVSLRVSYL